MLYYFISDPQGNCCCSSNFLFFLSHLQVWMFHGHWTLYLEPKSENWGAPTIWDSSGQRLTISRPTHKKWEMLHLLLLGMGEIHSGKIAVKCDSIYSGAEMSLESIASWRQLLAEGKEMATCCPRQEGLERCGSWSDCSKWGSEWGFLWGFFITERMVGRMVWTKQNTEGRSPLVVGSRLQSEVGCAQCWHT